MAQEDIALTSIYGRLDPVQRPRRPRRQAVRQEAERVVGLRAVSARHPRRQGVASVGVVTGGRAAAAGMARAGKAN